MSLDYRGSRTALITAAFRARDSERTDAVCHDPWAARLAGEDAVALAASAARRVPEAAVGVALRTRFFDHQLERWTAPASAIRQVVLLGAGLDTRAARLKRGGVRFFEVDHPSTQADKQRRIGALGDYPIEAATYVPCNFERDDFVEALIGSGFDAKVPALVLWEGVTAYLTPELVRGTLERVASALEPRSVIVFDYLAGLEARPPAEQETEREVRAVASEAGEPFRFALANPLPLLYEAGFRRVRVVSMEEVCLTITGTYDPERRMLGLWGIAVASCTAEVEP